MLQYRLHSSGVGFGGLGIRLECIVEAVGIPSVALRVYGGLEAEYFPGAHSLLL